jgi:16S rRNA (uracil1498-N3)-methyltransferase
MKLHRFFLANPIQGNEILIQDVQLLAQWQKVLRLKIGEHVILFDGSGKDHEAEISALSKSAATVRVLRSWVNMTELPGALILCCAVLKRENFEFVAQKAVEIGATEIWPLRTARTVKLSVKDERIQSIVREAAEQSGRGILPSVHAIISLDEALRELADRQASLFALDQDGEPLAGMKLSERRAAAVLVGPEGGWNDEEREWMRAAGARLVSLGTTTLRAETAAIVGSFAIARLLHGKS